MSEELHKDANGRLFWYARLNPKGLTPAEGVLWSALRGTNLCDYKFRRQHPIDDFIVDFYCHEQKLVIEIDGGYHSDISQAEYDSGRTFELTQLGITVIRFTNDEIINDLPSVLTKLILLLSAK